MSFFALLLAFVAEQIRPLPRHNAVHDAARSLCRWAGHALDAGSKGYAVLGWLLVALVPTILVWMLAALVGAIHPIFSLLFHVLVLWFTLGFRQFSHYFTELQLALARGDVSLARKHLHDWLQNSGSRPHGDVLTVPEICRTAIEEGVVASHRNVYGVLFWYAVLPGPAGAALYRLAGIAREEWGERTDAFGDVARGAFVLLDWVPARLTALGFAIVGNFEDALYGWRQRGLFWPDPQRGIIVESAAGALGVRLAPVVSRLLPAPVIVESEVVGPAMPTDSASASSEFVAPPDGGTEDAETRLPDPPALHAAVGLLWRAVVLWMFLLFLLSLGGWAA